MDRLRQLLRLSPLRIAGVYLVFGVMWILFSDRLAERLAADAAQLSWLQTFKGWFFVLASAAVIFVLVRLAARDLLAATARVRESQARLQQFASVTTEGLVFVEGARIVDANDQMTRLVGLARDRLLMRPLADLVSEADRPRLEPLFRSPADARIELQLANGRPVALTFRTVTHGGGARQVVGVHDLLHEHELELQLRQAQKLEAVALLTAGIAHDFNNVLSVILSNADLLQGALPPDRPELRQDVEDLRHSALAGAGMVRRLLGFSRQASLMLQPTDLRLLVKDIGGMLGRLLPDDIRVSIASREPIPTVQADQTAVQQILLNLATNARDAMPQGGSLEFTLERVDLDEAWRQRHPWVQTGAYVRVTAADTGTGMTADQQARAFDPFFTTKEPGEGTGLGLAMVYGLMKQHQGYIDLDSRPGGGTRVSVYFPVSRDGAEPAPAPAPAPPHGGSETVLLVEDDAVLRRTGRRVLEMLDYRVLTAGNGVEALRTLEETGARVDLVLCDVSMPEMGGVELYRTLRGRGSRLPFVFASGYAAQQVMESLGDRDERLLWLQKPWTLGDLAIMLRRALAASSPAPRQ